MLKVAFATADRERVNQHFGAATRFAIYSMDGERAKLVEVTEFPAEAMDGNEGKLAAKIAALNGCAAVYCLAVGGSAVRQLLASGIQPVRLDEVAFIDVLLAQLRQAVRDGGVPWIDKALKRDADGERFDQMAAEGWEE
jgi:nitrogen fixation protein NifX